MLLLRLELQVTWKMTEWRTPCKDSKDWTLLDQTRNEAGVVGLVVMGLVKLSSIALALERVIWHKGKRAACD